MKCTVRRTSKNLRYRILTIRGEKYILDMGGASLWKMLFPFFYWLLPNRVYKVEKPEIVEQLTASTVKEKMGSSQFLWTIVASIMASILSPLANYFEVDIPIYINVIIVAIIVALMLLLIFSVSRMLKKKMYQIIDLSQLFKGQLWITPVPFKFVFLVIFMYVGCLGLGVMGAAAYIQYGNWLILLFSMILIFVGIVMPSLITIIEGNTRVKFLGGKRAKVFPHN
ncbi:putative membrane protein (TIGR01218 family) [Virgibacillus natechei]|uniref:Membrane protein (TIGR01218 family) n=1 Tax=Virgibacillus natechei TaxID=1216297 RepID=A0ABS4IKD3_9BACI|nr:DUF443 family protein [Virgibacillus natechei]MBP1971417.1 putative membrane protein (TIGR01218 family) [Virgibacillus natechei]UZD13787.1 DUF443 domain-containing protein [Virgibacillus natechei]